MPKKEEVLLVVFLVIYVGLFMFLRSEYTGFAVAPNFGIDLGRTHYTGNESLEGNIMLNFSGNVDYDTEIIVELDGIKKELLLREILDKLNLSYNTTEGGYSAENPSQTRKLTLPAEIAFLLPKHSTVTEVSMDVVGDAEDPPSFVSMDVGMDNQKEWIYFGSFSNWDSTFINPASLDAAVPGSVIEIDTNETYLCELINLPFSRDYRVSASYRKINEGADIKAVILSFDGVNAYGGAERCDLPESTSLGWHSCNINFLYGIAGNHLVCVFIEKGVNENISFYQVSRDNTVSTSRYDCNALVEGSATCNQRTSKDYFIKVNPALYTKTLDSAVNFADWLTEYDIKTMLTNFLTDCSANEVGDCAVPVAIDSETGGKLNLSNLDIRLTENGGTSVYNKFYDLTILPQEISKINNTALADYVLAIPLSLFTIYVPSVDADKSLDLEVTIAPTTKSIAISASAEDEILDRISKNINNLNTLKSDYEDVASLLGISLNTAKLSSYKNQLDDIEEGNLSAEEKKSAKEELETEISEYISQLPSSITKSKEAWDTLIIEPADITIEVEDPMETYHLQRKIEVTVDAKEYEVTKNSGEVESHAVIDKWVNPKESLTGIYIYEIIPKTVASNTNKIKFKNQNYEVVEADPIVRFYYPQLTSTIHIIYSLKKKLVSSMVYGPKTIIVLKEEPVTPEEKPEYVCGDDICTRPYEDEKLCPEDCVRLGINWKLILIIIITGVIMFFWINVYTGWIDFRKLTKGKIPFKSEDELERIKVLIKNASKAGIKKELITDSLLRAGWKKNQIYFAFEDMEWDKRRELLIRKAPAKTVKINELVSYVFKCLELNMPVSQIRETLYRKGWTKEQTNYAIKKASGKSVLKSLKNLSHTLFRKKTAPKYFFEKRT